ncbi:hypothetical protein HY639_05180 [Candidatus Woesearchaeota archaeon]|nr:hypothetical protein [Candidatus Woesearchaeota archaeon]
MDEAEREAINKQVTEKKAAIDQLRKELNLLNEQKEHWFTKKEELNSKIASLIDEIKKSKTIRDECSQLVKENKVKRDELHAQLHEKLEKCKAMNKERADVLAKQQVKGDPAFLQREIQKLEQMIETSVMSFDKEKQLMKRINELKKQYKDVEKTSGVFAQAAAANKEIDSLRAQANELHKIVQIKAKESQEKHNLILTLSKEIDELRKQEQDAFAKFLEFKTKFAEINEKLKNELGELNQFYAALGEIKAGAAEQKHRRMRQELEKMEGQVEEKIKKRKKLTTEDLLVFQQQAEMEEGKK